MSNLRISDIVGIINKNYPFALAEDWDNVGLQLGDPAGELSRIMVALDPLPQVIASALALQCQLLVTHHPLIFSPLRQITCATSTGKSLLQAAQGNLAMLAMHTNYDIAQDGLNDLLAKRICLEQTRPLKITGWDELVKLAVFVPAEQFANLRTALLPFAESIGNYRDCSFTAAGEGTFRPLAGAQPAIGKIGTLEMVAEQRLELLVRREYLNKTINAMKKAHPYEEPAYDCYPLLNESAPVGLGRIGLLAESVRLSDWAATVARQLGCEVIRYVGEPSRLVKKVALCSGSGASLLRDAVRSGADVLVTGDVKYHDARDAEAQGIALIDAGHFATEILMVEAIRDLLEGSISRTGHTVELFVAENEQDPFKIISSTGVQK